VARWEPPSQRDLKRHHEKINTRPNSSQ